MRPPAGRSGPRRRRVAAVAHRTPRGPDAAAPARERTARPQAGRKTPAPPGPRGIRQRLANARSILAAAPTEAIRSMDASTRQGKPVKRQARASAGGDSPRPASTSRAAPDKPNSHGERAQSPRQARPTAARVPRAPNTRDHQSATTSSHASPPGPKGGHRPASATHPEQPAQRTTHAEKHAAPHPARKLTASTRRQDNTPAGTQTRQQAQPATPQRDSRTKPRTAAAASDRAASPATAPQERKPRRRRKP